MQSQKGYTVNMSDYINDDNFENAQTTIYHRIYKRLDSIIAGGIKQFLENDELSIKPSGFFVGFIFEKDIENTNQIYLLHYLGGDTDSLINLDLEIKLELYPEETRASVLYINDGFKTVYSRDNNKIKIHNWFIKWLWMLQDGRKECKNENRACFNFF